MYMYKILVRQGPSPVDPLALASLREACGPVPLAAALMRAFPNLGCFSWTLSSRSGLGWHRAAALFPGLCH